MLCLYPRLLAGGRATISDFRLNGAHDVSRHRPPLFYAPVYLETRCFCSQLVSTCHRVNPVWLPRSRSGAHADAQDDEAAAADEAFDFPRFVLPLFRDEARKSCLPAAGESISFYVR